MNPTEFVRQYEQALATQRWAAVEPLIHAGACVTFSNGASHRGSEAIRVAYERNFAQIEGEDFRVENVHWVRRSEDLAVYLFDFQWTGVIAGEAARGAGRGTATLVNDGDGWKLLAEHLGPAQPSE
ncbi:MAG: nuclear transport factor 2 family protein [Planctomycetota bacterium]